MTSRKGLSEVIEEAVATSTPQKHVMSTMHPDHGDVKTVWDPESEEEVRIARKNFDDMKAKGYSAFRVKKSGEKAELMHTFDPEAAAIILAPPIRGG
jgi:hypothetical protein